MDGPRPSSCAAPSIWYDAVAAPHTKPSGNRSPRVFCCAGTFRRRGADGCRHAFTAPLHAEVTAAAPAMLDRYSVRPFTFARALRKFRNHAHDVGGSVRLKGEHEPGVA